MCSPITPTGVRRKRQEDQKTRFPHSYSKFETSLGYMRACLNDDDNNNNNNNNLTRASWLWGPGTAFFQLRSKCYTIRKPLPLQRQGELPGLPAFPDPSEKWIRVHYKQYWLLLPS